MSGAAILSIMSSAGHTESALRVSLDVWHPDCWVIQTTEMTDVGFLGYGIFTEGHRATTLFTAYADTQATIDTALESIRASASVYSAAEMTHNYRLDTAPTPGNATRELLVTHDGRTQICNAFTARGFILAKPIDMRDGQEHWTLLTSHDRQATQERFEEVRTEEDAQITIQSIKQADRTTETGSLPLDRLSRRQLEVFELARKRGYYDWPKQVSATELANELAVTPSTVHEHLHKAEAKLLGDSDGAR